jgi:hypothetical protein
MRWIKVPKETASTPAKGTTYRDWKSDLANEGMHQCVYCAIHERALGGFWNFHVEHYRPKSKFPNLTNQYRNLFYACAICNTFKSNDWPSEPDDALSVASYPDPATVDYNRILSVDGRGSVYGLNVAARYVVEKIFLNRPQLILERRDCNAQDECDRVDERLNDSAEALMRQTDATSLELLKDLFRCTREIRRLHSEARKIRPYEPSQTKRN